MRAWACWRFPSCSRAPSPTPDAGGEIASGQRERTEHGSPGVAELRADALAPRRSAHGEPLRRCDHRRRNEIVAGKRIRAAIEVEKAPRANATGHGREPGQMLRF